MLDGLSESSHESRDKDDYEKSVTAGSYSVEELDDIKSVGMEQVYFKLLQVDQGLKDRQFLIGNPQENQIPKRNDPSPGCQNTIVENYVADEVKNSHEEAQRKVKDGLLNMLGRGLIKGQLSKGDRDTWKLRELQEVKRSTPNTPAHANMFRGPGRDSTRKDTTVRGSSINRKTFSFSPTRSHRGQGSRDTNSGIMGPSSKSKFSPVRSSSGIFGFGSQGSPGDFADGGSENSREYHR